MEPDILRLAQLFAVIGMFTAGMIGLAWVTKVAFKSAPRQTPRIAPEVDEARFSRLEDAVDAIAVEVERIAEAQRFSARLLAERANERSAERSTELVPERIPSSRT